MNLDWEGLVVGFESRSQQITHFLDRETGDVIQVVETREPERHAELAGSARYVALPRDRGERGIGEMELFVGEVEEPAARAELAAALRDEEPAEAYRAVLLRHPREEARFFQFKQRRARERAEEWLASAGIPFERKTPPVRAARDFPGGHPPGR
ncbi:MAG TPA: UPF0158 family protein [Thermoanaerobaculia bacterium]|nr:UPF0158 family protein [Thermoanaerobaculia bacterium]